MPENKQPRVKGFVVSEGSVILYGYIYGDDVYLGPEGVAATNRDDYDVDYFLHEGDKIEITL